LFLDDPYSGSNRYIPGGGGGNSQSSKPAQNGHNKGNKKRPCSNLAPLKQFFTFDLEGASNKVLQKLQESNDSQTDVALKLSQEEVSNMMKFGLMQLATNMLMKILFLFSYLH
jgi:hypothetical protein